MEYTVKSGSPEKQRIGCVVAAVYAPRTLSAAAKTLDKASGGLISNLIRRGELEATLAVPCYCITWKTRCATACS